MLTSPTADLRERLRRLEAERDTLLSLLAHQQRVAQAGLITSGLAHDVDNHVQAISGAAFLSLQRSDPAEWKHTLERIQKQCLELTETTRAFLSFVRRRESVVDVPFSVASAADAACRLVRPLAKRHGVLLEHTALEDADVLGDRRLAIQALVNLLSNAAKACRGREDAEIIVATSRPEPQTVRVQIRDNGPGIPEELRHRIFRPFASDESRGSNGLGLFIVRQNIRRLGGAIRVRSTPEGTMFEIDLPVA